MVALTPVWFLRYCVGQLGREESCGRLPPLPTRDNRDLRPQSTQARTQSEAERPLCLHCSSKAVVDGNPEQCHSSVTVQSVRFVLRIFGRDGGCN